MYRNDNLRPWSVALNWLVIRIALDVPLTRCQIIMQKWFRCGFETIFMTSFRRNVCKCSRQTWTRWIKLFQVSWTPGPLYLKHRRWRFFLLEHKRVAFPQETSSVSVKNGLGQLTVCVKSSSNYIKNHSHSRCVHAIGQIITIIKILKIKIKPTIQFCSRDTLYQHTRYVKISLWNFQPMNTFTLQN